LRRIGANDAAAGRKPERAIRCAVGRTGVAAIEFVGAQSVRQAESANLRRLARIVCERRQCVSRDREQALVARDPEPSRSIFDDADDAFAQHTTAGHQRSHTAVLHSRHASARADPQGVVTVRMYADDVRAGQAVGSRKMFDSGVVHREQAVIGADPDGVGTVYVELHGGECNLRADRFRQLDELTVDEQVDTAIAADPQAATRILG
jgi:hypothetical protein